MSEENPATGEHISLTVHGMMILTIKCHFMSSWLLNLAQLQREGKRRDKCSLSQ